MKPLVGRRQSRGESSRGAEAKLNSVSLATEPWTRTWGISRLAEKIQPRRGLRRRSRKKNPAQGTARRVGSGAAGVSGVQNRVKHEVCEDWRWTPMVCEGTWRFWGCARWPVDDGEWLKTQLTRFGVMAGAVLARRASVHFSTAPAHASGWHSKRMRICVELGLGRLWRSRGAILAPCTLYPAPPSQAKTHIFVLGLCLSRAKQQ